MIEFSRRHQEEQLTSKQESSMRQLTDDEINLEEKLKRLYELDGKLQETSCAVTSLQEDKVGNGELPTVYARMGNVPQCMLEWGTSHGVC